MKLAVTKPQDPSPWLNHFQDPDKGLGADPEFHLLIKGSPTTFDLSQIAATIGCAMVVLYNVRNAAVSQAPADDCYATERLDQVKALTYLVKAELLRLAEARRTSPEEIPILDEFAVYGAIETVLLRNELNDVLRAVLLRREHRDARLSHPATIRVIRRTGEVSHWNPNKIESAVRRAFTSLGLSSEPCVAVATEVDTVVKSRGMTTIHIEQVQDVVEETLMRLGHYKVAKAYILYREQRHSLRKASPGFSKRGLTVPKGVPVAVKLKDGSDGSWDGDDLALRVQFAMAGLDLGLTSDEIDEELRRSIFDGITADGIRQTVIMNAKSLMQRDADFEKFAARIFLTYIYEEVLDWDIVEDGIGELVKAHRSAFRKNLATAISVGRIHPDLRKMDMAKLSEALDPAADLDLTYSGVSTLYDRYFIVDKSDKTERRLETPQLFWMRVAMGLYCGEKKGEAQAIELYGLYKSRRFCSSTPTLFNSGTLTPQLSSCYLFNISDSMHSITLKGIHENAALCKWAGGLGGSWTSVRGMGARIKGTNGESQGVIPFLRMFNSLLSACNQGGKRKGSGCVYLEVWHNDFMDFLQLKLNTGDERRRIHDTNTASWIPDLFMQRMEARQEWTFFRSNEVKDLHELYGRAFKTRYEEYEVMAAEGKIYGKKVPALEVCLKVARQPACGRHGSCLAGETKVAVADGREAVPIDELARTGTKFPVYTARPVAKEAMNMKNKCQRAWVEEIKWAQAFRMGVREVVRVLLDDGTSFRCTVDHPLALLGGNYFRADEATGWSLFPFNRWTHPAKPNNRYIGRNLDPRARQARLIYQFYHGKVPKGFAVDHLINGAGDYIDNLQILPIKEHNLKTGRERMGERNPFFGKTHSPGMRKRMSERMRRRMTPEYRRRLSAKSKGIPKPDRYGLNQADLIKLGREFHSKHGNLGATSWRKYYAEDGLPSIGYVANRFPSWKAFVRSCTENHRVLAVELLGEVVEVFNLIVEGGSNFFIVTSETPAWQSGVLVGAALAGAHTHVADQGPPITCSP